jgi:hypothetical protein
MAESIAEMNAKIDEAKAKKEKKEAMLNTIIEGLPPVNHIPDTYASNAVKHYVWGTGQQNDMASASSIFEISKDILEEKLVEQKPKKEIEKPNHWTVNIKTEPDFIDNISDAGLSNSRIQNRQLKKVHCPVSALDLVKNRALKNQFKNLLVNKSGHRTDKPLENGGYINIQKVDPKENSFSNPLKIKVLEVGDE